MVYDYQEEVRGLHYMADEADAKALRMRAAAEGAYVEALRAADWEAKRAAALRARAAHIHLLCTRRGL